MNWTALLTAATVIVACFLFRHAGLISAKKARTHLKNGALVVDVRTVGEFVSGHLPIAVNLPVNELETSMTSYVKDKKQVILVHCQSGIRSSIAKKKLKAMGYANTFNLGTYARATQIVNGKQN
jgi:phage shock protein E